MATITLIAALGKNSELGKDNKLLFYLPEDLKFFRDNTNGKVVIMGINTFLSLPKLLPNRKHIILTHRDIDLGSDVLIFHDLESLLDYINILDGEIMVIGGSQIYKLMINYADKMLLTEINESKEADTYFPSFSKEDWHREIISNHEYQGIEYSHVMYKRKVYRRFEHE